MHNRLRLEKLGLIIINTSHLKVYLPPVHDIFCEFATTAKMTFSFENFAVTACKTLFFGFSAKFQVRYNLQSFWPRSGDFLPLSSRTNTASSPAAGREQTEITTLF